MRKNHFPGPLETIDAPPVPLPPPLALPPILKPILPLAPPLPPASLPVDR